MAYTVTTHLPALPRSILVRALVLLHAGKSLDGTDVGHRALRQELVLAEEGTKSCFEIACCPWRLVTAQSPERVLS